MKHTKRKVSNLVCDLGDQGEQYVQVFKIHISDLFTLTQSAL